MHHKINHTLSAGALAFALNFTTAHKIQAQNLPTAAEIAAEMGLGWNLGNTMEAVNFDGNGNPFPSPQAWGNDVPTQTLIDSVKAAGFNTIRIPTNWNLYADATTGTIDANWMNQVQSVVDMCIKDSLFVILNIHWDNGWLEDNINATVQQSVNARQQVLWSQIATKFKDYDRHLLFASANEPGQHDKDAIDANFVSVLNSYHQTFINAVRATGGNNASRSLIIQGPKTEIEHAINTYTTLPTDQIAGRLMFEFHFYPYNFSLMKADEDWGNGVIGRMFYFWGANNHSATSPERNPYWGEEAYIDEWFGKIKTNFVDKGIPAILGELGAIKRMTLTGDDLQGHLNSRRDFYGYVAKSGKANGIIPVVWDTGAKDNFNMTFIDRADGSIIDLCTLNGMRKGAGMSELPGTCNVLSESSAKILYSAKDSLFGQVNLGVPKADISAYDSIVVRAYVNGETEYTKAGAQAFGFVSLNLVTMSAGWQWKEANFGEVVMDSWNNYSIPLGTDTTVAGHFVSADPTAIDFFALQMYSEGYRGTVYIDQIVFVDNEGPNDTLFSFDLYVPTEFSGNVESISLIENSLVPTDTEWKTATQVYGGATPLFKNIQFKNLDLKLNGGVIEAKLNSPVAENAKVLVKNLLGQIVESHTVQLNQGANTLQLKTNAKGLLLIQVQTATQNFVQKVQSF